MIFEEDHRYNHPVVSGVKIFGSNSARLFSLLSDPASWNQKTIPRITSTTPNSKIIFSFDGVERVTASISSWKTEVSELELVIEGLADEGSQIRQEKYWSEVTDGFTRRLGASEVIVASSPAKVNLFFAVGSFLKDGFHEIASCYQALSLREKVLVELSGFFIIEFSGPYGHISKELVPTDQTNLVYKAGTQLASLGADIAPDRVSFLIHKSVPIAGGMAGGSADAAAALVALNALSGAKLDEQLIQAGANLGSDVPFSLTGGTAIGVGRGEKLSKIPVESILHWVITPSNFGLSTPDVYRKLDILRVQDGVDVSKLPEPEVPEDLIEALLAGDPFKLAQFMNNDLERAAIALKPELEQILKHGQKAGSLRSMVSGSGPTVIHLAKNRLHAEQVATRLKIAGFESIVSHTSHHGTRLEG